MDRPLSNLRKMKQAIIFDDQTLQRIDVFLASRATFSRSFFARLIETGAVFVNGKPISKAGFCPKLGDLIEFGSLPVVLSEKTDNSKPVDFQIIDEQKDFLIINKPAGLLVHSTSPSCTEPSLVDGLNSRFFSSQLMPKELRGGIVHRLDKETSGLLLVAKNIQAHAALSALFSGRKINKTYQTVVCGKLEKTGKIVTPIGRHPVERHKRTCYGVGMKEAFSEFECLEQINGFSLARVKIHTGRTHQIRVHMAWIGHSVVGDFLYGQKSDLIGRQALHASTLEFNFNGKLFSYQADLPEDIKGLIEKLQPAPQK